MKRRLNFTGRIRIAHSDISIKLIPSSDSPLKFTADRNLQDYSLPADALVYLEAYLGRSYMRFCWGTVAKSRFLGTENELTEIEQSARVLFRVKVVGTGPTTNGMLLAQADRITVDASEQPILPVKYADLNEIVWQLDFEDDAPFLVVNNRIEGMNDIVRFDPSFAALVFPTSLRTVLHRMLDERSEDGDDEQPWVENWITFARTLTDASLPDSNDFDQRQRWIDDSVNAFSKKNRLLNRYRAI